jgi:hypothetical protein
VDLKTGKIVPGRFAKAFAEVPKTVLSNRSKECEFAGFPRFWAT